MHCRAGLEQWMQGYQGKQSGCHPLGPMFLNWISLQLGPTVGPGPGCAVNGLLGQTVLSLSLHLALGILAISWLLCVACGSHCSGYEGHQ